MLQKTALAGISAGIITSMFIKVTQRILYMTLFTLGLVLSSCQAEMSAAPEAELPPTITQPAASPTRDWFPATATSTIVPITADTPTPGLRPEYGPAILSDDFSNEQDWQSGEFPNGNIAFGQDSLHLAVAAGGSGLTSFRINTFFTDMYWDIMISPNLCSPKDQYGLIFWSVNGKNYHKLAFNCSSQYMLSEVKGSQETARIDWTASSQVPRGGFSSFRVGLWVGGGLVRIYLNDIYQTEIYLPPGTGGIGVFAQSANGPALNVSFSDLQIYGVSIDQYPPTPTITPTITRTPFPTLPTP